MMIRLITALLLGTTAGLASACTATADPPTSTSEPKSAEATRFPDMSNYTPANPDDYTQRLDNPGRPNKRVGYFFNSPDGVRCAFGEPALASCSGNNLPSVPTACDPIQHAYRYNSISTNQGVQQWPLSTPTCEDNSPASKVLPPFHTLTVYGVTCGVDDQGTTACKDPQGRAFVLSPSWSGWIPKV